MSNSPEGKENHSRQPISKYLCNGLTWFSLEVEVHMWKKLNGNPGICLGTSHLLFANRLLHLSSYETIYFYLECKYLSKRRTAELEAVLLNEAKIILE